MKEKAQEPQQRPRKQVTPRTKRRRNSQPSGYWASKLDTLLKATGWNADQVAYHFQRSPRTISRIRRGSMSAHRFVAFVVKLRELEARFCSEIQALEQNEIVWRNGRRFDWRDVSQCQRPDDLMEIGRVEQTSAAKEKTLLPPGKNG